MAAAAPTVEPYFQDSTLAVGAAPVSRQLFLYADEPTTLTDVSLRYDYRSLADTITVTPAGGQECTAPEPGVLVCTEPDSVTLSGAASLDSGIYRGIAKRVSVSATADAQLGDSGDVAVSFEAAGGRRAATPRGSASARASTWPAVRSPSTPPGRAGSSRCRWPSPTRATRPSPDSPRSSTSATRSGPGTGSATASTPATTWSPASSTRRSRWARARHHAEPRTRQGHLRTDQPVRLRAVPDDCRLRGPDPGAGSRRSRAATPGSGPKLTLAEAPSRMRKAAQTDVGPGYDYTGWGIKATGKNGTDLAAIGDTLSGRAGAVLTATVGFRNNGPATLDKTNGDYEAATHTVVELPPGTTAVEIPDSCQLRPGTRTYQCASEMLLVAGETYAMEFRLRIDKVISNARGTVWVNAPCECPSGGNFEDDTKPANDRAAIVVNAAPGGGGNGGGSGGGGGSLPITGTPPG
ncbi:hypothetical protein NKG94_35070 [Micromonospora sp. M12]